MRVEKTAPTESTQMTRKRKTASRIDRTTKRTATNQPRTRHPRTSFPQPALYRTYSNAPMWTSAME